MSLKLGTRSLCPFLYPSRSSRLLSSSARSCSARSSGASGASASSSRTTLSSGSGGASSTSSSLARRRFSGTAYAARPPSAAVPDVASSRAEASPQWPLASSRAADAAQAEVIETTAPAPEEAAAAAQMGQGQAGPSSAPAAPSASPSASAASAATSASAAAAEACATLSPSSPSAPRSQKSAAAASPEPAAPAAAAPAAKGEDAGTAEMKPAKSKPRASAFKPRKSALTLTPTAVERLSALLSSPSGPKLIRIGVRNKGCAGMSYHLEYVRPEEAGRFDERVKQDGVEVLIDSKALFSIIGSEMDWQEDRLSAKFVFNNPNVTEACGCGESWTTV